MVVLGRVTAGREQSAGGGMAPPDASGKVGLGRPGRMSSSMRRGSPDPSKAFHRFTAALSSGRTHGSSRRMRCQRFAIRLMTGIAPSRLVKFSGLAPASRLSTLAAVGPIPRVSRPGERAERSDQRASAGDRRAVADRPDRRIRRVVRAHAAWLRHENKAATTKSRSRTW